jgi:hypothetical protein
MRSEVSNGAQAAAGDGWFISVHLPFIELFICVAPSISGGDVFLCATFSAARLPNAWHIVEPLHARGFGFE